MSDPLGRWLAGADLIRRFAWRLGRRLYTSARAEQIDLDIETDGEADLIAMVVRNTGPTCVVFDIGANQGDWSERFLMEFERTDGQPKGQLRLELFEPVPSTISRLNAKIERYVSAGVARVNTVAISDEAGSFEMAIMSETGGTNSLHFDPQAGDPPGGWIKVETVRLDDFCVANGIIQIDMIKCDTEGNDYKVLKGASRMLKAGAINIVQFEYNHRWVFGRAYLKDVFDLISGSPYSLGKIVPGGVELYDGWHMELERFFQSNYVLVHERALPWIAAHRGTFDISNTYARISR